MSIFKTPKDQSFDKKLLKRFAILLSFAFAFIAIILNHTVSFFAFSLSGIIILSTYSEYLVTRFQLLKDRVVRIGIYVLLMLIGFGALDRGDEVTSNIGNRADTQKRDAISYINTYISRQPSKPILLNVNRLKYWENMYEDSDINEALDIQMDYCIEDSINAHSKKIIYAPQFIKDGKLKSETYLKSIPNYGVLRNYKLIFYLKDSLIDSVVASIDCEAGGGLKTFTIDNPQFDLRLFANQYKIAKIQKDVVEYKQIQAIAKQNEVNQEALKNAKENFEKSCLSAWDGSCQALVSYVKDNMNNPKSFDHVETRYFMAKDYAIVIMKYRGTNAFGGIVTNYIKAKVSFDCQVLSILEE